MMSAAAVPVASQTIAAAAATTATGSHTVNRECTSRSELGERAGVHPLDVAGVVRLHHPSLDLQRRGQLTGLHREVPRQDGEPLDGLPPVEPFVELLDVAGDHLLGLG